MNGLFRGGARTSLAALCLAAAASALATPIVIKSSTRVVDARRNLALFDAAGHALNR